MPGASANLAQPDLLSHCRISAVKLHHRRLYLKTTTVYGGYEQSSLEQGGTKVIVTLQTKFQIKISIFKCLILNGYLLKNWWGFSASIEFLNYYSGKFVIMYEQIYYSSS